MASSKGSPRRLQSLTAGLVEPAAWIHRRNEIKHTWLQMIGGLPERVPVQYEPLSTTVEASHTRYYIRYQTAHQDTVTAYLLIPHTDLPPAGSMPAIMALHPTHPDGKDDIAVPTGREGRQYGLELVERGYVVLAPDTITAGERKSEDADYYHTSSFYEQHSDWSAVGKMLIDHLYGVDLLSTLPEVDTERIGAIGHSLGGYNAYFLAGMDDRINAVAVSCGLATFYGDPDPNRWGQRDWFTHLPKVTEKLAEGHIPFDFHEIAALAAPAPFFCWIAQQDQYMPHWKEISEAAAEINELYEYLQAGGRFQALIGTSRHDFPDPIRGLAYEFLDKWLKNKGNAE